MTNVRLAQAAEVSPTGGEAGPPGLRCLAIGAFAQGASGKYLLVKLWESPSYDAAYGKVHQQLTALKLRTTGLTKLAECRNQNRHEVASLAAGGDCDLACGGEWTDNCRSVGGACERSCRAKQAAALQERPRQKLVMTRPLREWRRTRLHRLRRVGPWSQWILGAAICLEAWLQFVLAQNRRRG